jgi:hypothetical protein
MQVKSSMRGKGTREKRGTMHGGMRKMESESSIKRH